MENKKLETMRHSLSHIMAHAVKNIYPKVKFAIGPALENGFYYDFDFGKEKVGEEDLNKIEKEMKKILKKNQPFKKRELKIEEAIKKEEKSGQFYKKELLEDLKTEGESKASYYKVGEFEDLCKGPHIKNASKSLIGNFKLVKLAGAYWRGDEKNKMLTRIYAYAFLNKKELDNYLKMMEEAEKRNHLKIGKQMDLFSFHEECPGFPFFHAKGMVIWNELMKFWKDEHTKAGYDEITTPVILKRKLWEQSGHWDHYKDNMYFTKIDKEDYAIKPMNCPGGVLVYKNTKHSYKELPIKLAEIGLVHRHELSGTLNGLFRVRSFKQDDAHIYCTEEQIKYEVVKVIDLIDNIYSKFGLKYHMELSTKPEKAIGNSKMWKVAEKALEDALNSIKADFALNPGDGAFYGPKIDFHIKDAIGRTWQCGTIQLDFAMPDKFDLEYVGKNGKEHKPVMLHRTVFGGIERFYGILVEHYAGAFPLWLSPVQVKVLPIGEKHRTYALEVLKALKQKNIRAEIDINDDTLGKKIRFVKLEKIPYYVIIGDKEVKQNNVTLESRDSEKADILSVDELANRIARESKKNY